MNYESGFTLLENLVALSLISVILFPLVIFFIRQEKMIIKLNRDLMLERASYHYLINDLNGYNVNFDLDSLYQLNVIESDNINVMELYDRQKNRVYKKNFIR